MQNSSHGAKKSYGHLSEPYKVRTISKSFKYNTLMQGLAIISCYIYFSKIKYLF